MKYIILKILSIFDFYHTKKLLNFLKIYRSNIKIVFDVGGHRGETLIIYSKYFKLSKIYSFEPIRENYNFLIEAKNNLSKKYSNTEFITENVALGSSNKDITIKFMKESSSSTIKNINTNSNYFKKKSKFLYKKNQNFFEDKKITQLSINSYMKINKIDQIDLLKIDTEGYEYEVLLGTDKYLHKIKIIIFEHHYDNMIEKKYTFSDINKLLLNNNFQQIYKKKMPFRKTFEYIYKNKIF